jgi:hypothetical protein
LGAKISALPLVPVFALATAWGGWRKMKFTDAAVSVAWFLIGLALAVPLLLVPVAVAVIPYYAWRRFLPALSRFQPAVAALSLALGGYFGRAQINSWLDYTIRNTAHDQDQAAVNALTWVGNFFHQWLGGPLIWNIAVASLGGLLVLWCILRQARQSHWQKVPPAAFPFLGGAAMCAAVFISAHRLWGFYLMPGVTLMLPGLVACMEAGLIQPAGAATDRALRALAAASAALTLGLGVVYWLPYNLHILNLDAHRTDDPSYRAEYASFVSVKNFLASHAGSLGRRISVQMDPYLFLPPDTPAYGIKQFWGPYREWDKPVDVLIFGKSHAAGAPPPPAASQAYSTFLIERADYRKYVIGDGQSCRQTQCYRRAVSLPDGGEILVRVAAAPA